MPDFINRVHSQACVLIVVYIYIFFVSDDWEIPFESISDLQWLGSGAQGAVFLGKLNAVQVAVKKVRDLKETDIRHLRKLNHPNIINFK